MKKKFIISFITTFIIFYFLIFSLNILVDPLWYLNGNVLQKNNYVFNERLSKTNLFYKNQNKYDCILFGSSISTTINASLFKKNKCFNYSFSAGGIEEYYLVLSYFYKKIKLNKVYIEIPNTTNIDHQTLAKFKKSFPDIEITGFIPPIFTQSLLNIDESRSQNHAQIKAPNLPDFFYNSNAEAKPESFFFAYSSSRVFIMSVKSLLKITDYKNSYDQNFVGFVYNKTISKKIQKKKIIIDKNIKSRIEYLALFRYNLKNSLDNIYDFSLPTESANSYLYTYDGSHYFENFLNLLPSIIENKLNLNDEKIIMLRIDSSYSEKFIQILDNYININAI
jgi:hypothetical protein